jgi:hypothetical protein
LHTGDHSPLPVAFTLSLEQTEHKPPSSKKVRGNEKEKMTTSFLSKILAPGGGILLIPFTRGIIACLFLVTSTVFIVGAARIHMFILSCLSCGMYFSLGFFEKAYAKALGQPVPVPSNVSKQQPQVTTKSKRED